MGSIGLIGFGRFGQLLHRFLYQKYHVPIYDPQQQYRPLHTNFTFASLEEVCYNPLVILAVPISAIEGLVRVIAKFLPVQTIVMDVCSVKVYPLQILEKYLPTTIEIVGSHPLFGPESVRESLRGHKVVLVPRRISPEKYQMIQQFWQDLGVRTIEMDAYQHDKLMAWTLALTHFLGRGLRELPLPETQIATRDFRILKNLVDRVNRDTIQLFQDMHRFNPETRTVRKSLIRTLKALDKALDELK